MKKKVKAMARVRILLEVTLPDVWDEDCLLSQVQQQSKDTAVNIISQRIVSSMRDIRILGEPETTVILIEEKTT